MEQMKARLKELCGLTGISAREDEVVRYMKENLSRYSKQVTVDMLGNVTAYFPCGKEDAKKMTVEGDATINLPIIYAGLAERLL